MFAKFLRPLFVLTFVVGIFAGLGFLLNWPVDFAHGAGEEQKADDTEFKLEL